MIQAADIENRIVEQRTARIEAALQPLADEIQKIDLDKALARMRGDKGPNAINTLYLELSKRPRQGYFHGKDTECTEAASGYIQPANWDLYDASLDSIKEKLVNATENLVIRTQPLSLFVAPIILQTGLADNDEGPDIYYFKYATRLSTQPTEPLSLFRRGYLSTLSASEPVRRYQIKKPGWFGLKF